MNTKKSLFLASVATLTLGAMHGVAHAEDNAPQAGESAGETSQANQGGVGGTILVTARRREENLRDIPLAIEAYGGEQIEREALFRVDDLTKLEAGLTFDLGGFPNDTRPALRGMQAERGRPSVAILLDGHDLSGENLSIAGGTSSLQMDLFDLERIEIVKGPQATLYGRNAFAGAINYISKEPTCDWEGRVVAEIADGGLFRASGMVSGPIVEDYVAIRLNGTIKEFDGYYINPVNGGKLGAEKTEGVSVALLFTPTSNLKLSGRYQYLDTRASDNPTAFIFANERLRVPDGTFTAGPPGTPPSPCPPSFDGLPPSIAGTVTQACTRGVVTGRIDATEADVQMSLNPVTGQPPFGMKMNSHLASAKVELETDGFGTFTYAFGYLNDDSEIEQDGDFTSTPAPPGMVLSISALQQLAYENEHTNHSLIWTYDNDWLSLIIGGQLFNEDSSLVNSAQFWLRSPTSPLAGPPFFLNTAPVANPAFPVINTRETDYKAVFAGVGVEPIEGLRLNAEVRYNDDQIDYFSSGQRRQDVSLSNLTPTCLPGFAPGATFSPQAPMTSPPPGVVVACPQNASIDDSRWTPRLSAQYEVSPEIMGYVSYAEGFKPGGFHTNEIVTFDNQGYAAETVKTYEAGIKTVLFDNHVLFNLTAYRNNYRDQQIGVQLSEVGAGGRIVTTAGIVNAGVVRTQGIEVDLTIAATDNLTFGLDYSLTDSKFRTFVQGPAPGSPDAAFAACGVPSGQTSSDQNRAEAGNSCADFSGNRVGKNPKHSLNLSAIWEADLGNVEAFIEPIASYRSKRFVDESNLAFLPSYWVASIKGGITYDNVSVTLYVENLFDEDKIQSAQRLVDFGNPEGFAPGRGYLAYLPQPRTFGLRFGVDF